MVDITKYIAEGSQNARTSKELAEMTGLTPRIVRELISKKRRETVILNMQDGHGYFIPSKEERPLLERWKNQEESRLKQIALALRAVRKELKGADNER